MFDVRRDSENTSGHTQAPEVPTPASTDELTKHRHRTLMDLLEYERDRQAEERMQMAIDEDYYDHLQWRPEDASVLMSRGQAPVVFNEARQTIDWIAGTEKRMRKDYKILPREPNDEQGAEIKTKVIKYTDDVNETQWHRSKAFKQAACAGLSWLEEGLNPDPEKEVIYSGMEDWRNVYRDSHSRSVDYNEDARYLFRRKVLDLDYATMLLPKSAEHLKSMAGRHDDIEQGDDIWYLGERLTGAMDAEWSDNISSFGERSAYMSRAGYFDNSRRRSVELLECWYRVPEKVEVFQGGQLSGKIYNPADPLHKMAREQMQATGEGAFYESVKFRMRIMIATKEAPCIDIPSPLRHNRFTMVPIFGYRRARDGSAYGSMRGMRDIQDDLNKRRSKALYALSVNRIVMDEGAVEDIEDTRQEAARPDGIIVKKQNKALSFEKNVADFQANLELAQQDSQLLRNVGGVTNENLGRDTNAQSGKAIGLKQDQGSLTTSELFDNYLLAIKQAGRLRLSHIEQFYTDQKIIRITGESSPLDWIELNKPDQETGQILNDITASQADFVVDTQDYRASMAQAAMEQMFDLLGKVATFAPQVVLQVLDLVVDTAEIKNKDEWVSRIRKLNGQRDPSKRPTPEDMQAEQAGKAKQAEVEQIQVDTAKAGLGKLLADIDLAKATISKLDTEGVLKRVESMYSALQAAQIVASIPGVTPAADEIAASAGLVDAHAGAIPVPQIQPEVMPPTDQAGPLVGMNAGIETPTGADNAPIPPTAY